MKTKQEILEQTYMSVKDLKQLTGLGLTRCQNIMRDLREEAKEEGYFIPVERNILVPTKIVKRKFKI
jgi:hypothetical protein